MTGAGNGRAHDTAQQCARILAEVEQVIVGKRDPVTLVLLGILAAGHILIEDLPGLGKTLLARSFATALGLEFTRVQFTPDLLPADLTGAPVLRPAHAESSLPARARCSPTCCWPTRSTAPRRRPRRRCWRRWRRARSASTARTHLLAAPFVVLATDNPIEYEGTYPLPEAQLDRFTARVRLGYLDRDGEAEMLRRRLARVRHSRSARQVTDVAGLLAMRESLEGVHIDPDLLGYVWSWSAPPVSTRRSWWAPARAATLAIMQLARGHAVLAGREFVAPEDVKAVAVAALAHRLVLRPEMWVRQVTGEDIVTELTRQLPVPRAQPTASELAP